MFGILIFKMSLPENQKNEIQSRAKEIDTGAIPLPFSNVLFGLPYKPDPATNDTRGISAPKWDYGDLISQKKLVTTLSINTDSEGEIWSFWNTWQNVVDLHVGSLKRIMMMRHWDLNFLFEIRSNFQQVGQLVILYSNAPKHAAQFLRPNWQIRYANQCQLPHIKVLMGEDVDVPLTIKWNSPLKGETDSEFESSDSGYAYSPGYDMGEIKLLVPFKMQVAKDVWPTMSVRIWSWLSSTTYGGYMGKDSIIS